MFSYSSPPSSDFSKYYFPSSIQTELLLQFFFLWSIVSDTKAEIITAKKVSYFIHTLFFVSIRVKRLPFITSFLPRKKLVYPYSPALRHLGVSVDLYLSSVSAQAPSVTSPLYLPTPQNGDCYHAFFSLSSFATELLNSEVFTAPFFLRIFRNNKAELFTAKIFIFPLSFAVQKGLLLQILDFIPVNILITKPITWKKSFFRSKRRFFHLSWHEIISVWRKRNLRFQMKEPPLSRKESPL